jgi:hypothetical protein
MAINRSNCKTCMRQFQMSCRNAGRPDGQHTPMMMKKKKKKKKKKKSRQR